MENKISYSHESYRTLLKEARIYDGHNDCYFCSDCKRFVPKKEGNTPCPICSSTKDELDNPLVQEILNTKPIEKYMFETFKGCIEPFTNFEKQYWKNGHFFYRQDGTEHLIDSETSNYTITDIQMWGVSHDSWAGCGLSLCVCWTEIIPMDSGRLYKQRYIRYYRTEAPELYPDYNQGKDDEFYFNLIFNDLIPAHCRLTQIKFTAINEKKEAYHLYLSILPCCKAMWLYPDKFIGTLYHEDLLDGMLCSLMTALKDFSLIPRYWGCDY